MYSVWAHFTFLKNNNYLKHFNIKISLTIQTHIDFRMCLMPDFLLCGDTVIAVGLCHISFDGDVKALSLFRDLRLLWRNGLIVTVPPLDCRFGGSTFNNTLKERPVICFIKICHRRLCSSCEHTIVILYNYYFFMFSYSECQCEGTNSILPYWTVLMFLKGI